MDGGGVDAEARGDVVGGKAKPFVHQIRGKGMQGGGDWPPTTGACRRRLVRWRSTPTGGAIISWMRIRRVSDVDVDARSTLNNEIRDCVESHGD